jgi:monoamine oxidase
MLFPDHYKPADDALHNMLAPLLEAAFAQDQWSQRYLRCLAPLQDETLVQSLFHRPPQAIVSRVNAFYFQNPGHAEIRFQSAVASPIGQPQRLALVVLILDTGQRLLGFWRKTFWRTTDDELECHFDMLKTRLDCQALRGISKAIKPYFDQLNQSLGVAREYVEADWIGRLVWADYYDLDETHFYIEDGRRLSTVDVLRRNFNRFLIWHDLQCSDLTLTTPAGKQPLTHPEQLITPIDFAGIEHRHGTLLSVDVLLDDMPRRVEHRMLPVGKAFMLADFTDTHDNAVELVDGYYGEHVCDRTMPYWFGVRHTTRPRHAHSRRVQHFERHEIVIVGAGLAGLTAAVRLEGASRQPVVYEANPSHIGGRIRSLVLQRRSGQLFLDERQLTDDCLLPATATEIHDETFGVIEAGGEFIGSHHKAIQTLAQELGLGLIKIEPTLYPSHILVSPSPETLQTLNAFAAQHQPLIDRIRVIWQRWRHGELRGRLQMMTLDRFLAQMDAPETFRHVIHGFVRAQFGAEMHQVALYDWFEMLAFDHQGHVALLTTEEFGYRMKGGLQQLPLALARQLSQPVRTGHTLTELRSADDHLYMLDFRDADGESLRVLADFVILAVPVGPLRRDIRFDLPMHTSLALHQVSHQPMGHNTKTIAWFRKPFWRSYVPDAFFYLSTPGFTLWEPAMSTMDSTLFPLMVYTGGIPAKAASESAACIESVLAHLESTFPAIRQDFVTAVQPMHWSHCPHTQGSYTGFGTEAIDFDRLHGSCGPLSHGHLTLAGEAMSLDFRGFAEGAVETGLRAADRIVAGCTSGAVTDLSRGMQPGRHVIGRSDDSPKVAEHTMQRRENMLR